MKYISRLTALALIGLMAIAASAADKPKPADPAKAQVAANPAFEKIKSLAGDWENKLPDGKVFPVKFRVVSAGSAVLISMAEPAEGEMITVIHPDGSDLMATHYCSAKNQPRFVAVPSGDPNVIKFKLKDITNLASPDAGHMVGVVFTLTDADHHTEAWTYSEAGKEQTEAFQLTRKK